MIYKGGVWVRLKERQEWIQLIEQGINNSHSRLFSSIPQSILTSNSLSCIYGLNFLWLFIQFHWPHNKCQFLFLHTRYDFLLSFMYKHCIYIVFIDLCKCKNATRYNFYQNNMLCIILLTGIHYLSITCFQLSYKLVKKIYKSTPCKYMFLIWVRVQSKYKWSRL